MAAAFCTTYAWTFIPVKPKARHAATHSCVGVGGSKPRGARGGPGALRGR